MREIKFRIFSPDDGMVTREVDCFLSFDPSGVVNDMNVPAIHVMQYTGLKDKNGTEIYEGDIVEVSTDNGREIGEYRFVGGTFIVSGTSTISSVDTVVLGNIHEHKHLLY